MEPVILNQSITITTFVMIGPDPEILEKEHIDRSLVEPVILSLSITTTL